MVEADGSSAEQPALLSVWNDLATDCRVRAVRLMVELALKFVTSQLEGRPKEIEDVKPNGDSGFFFRESPLWKNFTNK